MSFVPDRLRRPAVTAQRQARRPAGPQAHVPRSAWPVFVLASMACAWRAGPGRPIAARFVQGTGGAMTSAVTLGMIVRLYDKPADQGRAIGAFAFTGAVGASAGLIIGGILVQYASWHWIFFVNLPIGLLTGIAGWRVLAADQGIGTGPGGWMASATVPGNGRCHAGGFRHRPARALVGSASSRRPAGWVQLFPRSRARPPRASRFCRCGPRLPQRLRRQPRPVCSSSGAAMGFQGDRGSVHAARAGLQPGRIGPGPVPGRHRHRHRVAWPVGPADQPSYGARRMLLVALPRSRRHSPC